MFNEGSRDLVDVMNKLYVDVACALLRTLSTKDARCIAKGHLAASTEACAKCKDNMVQKAQSRRRENARDGDVYGAGLP